jgi:hypothetical protein
MVYRALIMAVQEEQNMENTLVEELRWVKKRKAITEVLEHFVMDAYKDCAISARERASRPRPCRS